MNWGDDEGLLEGQCLMFVDFDTIKLEPNLSTNQLGMGDPHNIMSHGKTVLIHSTSDDTEEHTRPFQKVSNNNNCPRILRQVVNAVDNDSDNNDDQSCETDELITRLVNFRSMESTYQLVSCDSIDSPCFVIIDESVSPNDISLPGGSKSIFSLLKKEEWHFKFLDYRDKDMLYEGSLNEDSDIESEDERYSFEG